MSVLQLAANDIKGMEKRRRFLFNHDRMKVMSLNYTLRNGGHQAIIMIGGQIADFWPATERWKTRAGSVGLGLDSLVQHLRGYQGGSHGQE